jgi:hypothetical protein
MAQLPLEWLSMSITDVRAPRSNVTHLVEQRSAFLLRIEPGAQDNESTSPVSAAFYR